MEQFSFEKAQEEAIKMQEKIASGEARTYYKAEKLVNEEENKIERNEVVEGDKKPTAENTQENRPTIDNTSRNKEDVGKITALREEILGMGKEGTTHENITPSRELKDLEDSFIRFATALDAREKENLNPLIERGHTSRLISHVRNLDEIAQQQKLDMELLKETVSGISLSLSKFGDVPRENIVRENSENLKRITYTINNSMDMLKGLYKKLPETHETEETRLAIKNLMGRMQRINDFVMRKRIAFERFSGR